MNILLFFHGGSLNRGCEAIVRSAIKVLRNKDPHAKIALASTNPDTDRLIGGLDEVIYHNQNRGFTRFSKLWWQNFIDHKFLNSRKTSYRLMHQDIISRIENFDVFLSIGGDNYCYGDIPDYYELNRIIKSKGKKLILWGASLGKEDIKTAAKIEDLKNFDRLLIRETVSIEDLNLLGINNAELVGDGAFLLDKELLPLPVEFEEGNTIGFNYSPLVQKKHPDSRKAVLLLLEHILKTTAYKIAMTPHVVIPGNDDAACMRNLFDDLQYPEKNERVFFLPDTLNALQVKGFISRMDLFIGARTHATIAAYSSAVPTMVLGYSIKSLGIAKDLFGEERLVLKSSEISDPKLLISKFEELVTDQQEIKKILEQKVPEIQKMSNRAAEFI